MPNEDKTDGYVLSRTAAQYERLTAQANLWAPFTERVLDKAGLGPGMSVLDAGCGRCEVMRLMLKRVGQSGQVTGVDIDAAVGAYGLQRLMDEAGTNVAFHTSDMTAGEVVPGAPFDMVFRRFFLIHVTDPVGIVRKLAAMLKPGGTLILMDYVLNAMQVAPDEPTLRRGVLLLLDVFDGMGKPTYCGVRLGEYITRAGLPMPAGADAKSHFEITGREPSMLAAVLESLQTPAVKLGLCSEEELAQLVADVRRVADEGRHCLLRPTVTSVWVRLPG